MYPPNRYNGVADEGVANRVLYATSIDAITWSDPYIMFNTTGPVGLENEPSGSRFWTEFNHPLLFDSQCCWD
jgi:hypothetical protein